MQTPAFRSPPARVRAVDRARGAAVLMMVVYHFSFDLDQYGWIHQAFNTDLRWLALRALIVSLFMGALGASLVLAYPDRVAPRHLLRRQLKLGAAALLVSAGSALMFPDSFIWFGILHFAWVATLLALPLRHLGWPLLPAAALVAWAGNGPAAPVFDTPWLGWIGFMTHKPYTEDYVPLFPWFAAVLVGLWIGSRLRPGAAATTAAATPAAPAQSQSPVGPADATAADRLLCTLGRHTLLIYLLHQPLLIGLLASIQWLGWHPGG